MLLFTAGTQRSMKHGVRMIQRTNDMFILLQLHSKSRLILAEVLIHPTLDSCLVSHLQAQHVLLVLTSRSEKIHMHCSMA